MLRITVTLEGADESDFRQLMSEQHRSGRNLTSVLISQGLSLARGATVRPVLFEDMGARGGYDAGDGVEVVEVVDKEPYSEDEPSEPSPF